MYTCINFFVQLHIVMPSRLEFVEKRLAFFTTHRVTRVF